MRNTILKLTCKKGSISGLNMRRILFHMTHRAPSSESENDTETETRSYNSMSSPSRSYEENVKSREERAKKMDKKIVP